MIFFYIGFETMTGTHVVKTTAHRKGVVDDIPRPRGMDGKWWCERETITTNVLKFIMMWWNGKPAFNGLSSVSHFMRQRCTWVSVCVILNWRRELEGMGSSTKVSLSIVCALQPPLILFAKRMWFDFSTFARVKLWYTNYNEVLGTTKTQIIPFLPD